LQEGTVDSLLLLLIRLVQVNYLIVLSQMCLRHELDALQNLG